MKPRDLDEFLDRQKSADAVQHCVDKGVTERAPVVGVSYAAFAVHSPQPGNLLGLAVAHRRGARVVVDLGATASGEQPLPWATRPTP